MVKNTSQSAPKVSNKVQLNCVKKATKYKVRTTDIFNFKRVVHEETGKGSNTTNQPENPMEQAPVIDLGDDQAQAQDPDPAMEAAVSMDSSEWCNYLVQANYNNMNYMVDAFHDVSSMNQQMGFDDQPWMFGVEEPSRSFCNYYAQHIEQEVSIYDYGYSG